MFFTKLLILERAADSALKQLHSQLNEFTFHLFLSREVDKVIK